MSIDVQQTPWLDAFFSSWSFESPEGLLAAVRSTDLDLEAATRNRDLSNQGLSGWTYWFLYLKGYTQYAEAGEVADSNVYYRYLTEYFEQDEGLAQVLRDREAARTRVRRRFEDFEGLAAGAGEQPEFEPITIWTQEPAPVDAKLVFVDDSSAPLLAVDIDGYHRLFAARLHGLDRVPAEVVHTGPTGAEREVLKRIREIVRFTLPYNAKVAVVVSGPDEAPPDLEGRETKLLELAPDADADRLRAELDAVSAAGCEYALIPAPLIDLAEGAGVLDLGFRLLARDREACYVVSLVAEDPGLAEVEQAESLPLPPQEMRLLSSGSAKPDRFVASGRTGLEWLRTTLARHDVSLDDGTEILEFGCGAGRYLRHLSQHPGSVVGADYNPYLLAWTEANLRFARFAVCGPRPPLAEPDDRFDVVYAVDVFSHLDDSAQVPWFDELTRVLRPGGLMAISLHGASRTKNLSPALRRTFAEGRLAVLRPTLSGTNGCAAYHPRAYVERVFGERLPIVEYAEQAALELRQDVAVFRKPER
ncbi:MAG TPA: class I SAM-dependent methyltransferase [Solirubrobacterales bacterium]|nr:class I SAM-dependent methyltransferase [Solirubrobacterales bacterium]